jgi:hypothetical protein
MCIANCSVTFGMRVFESLSVKLSETDIRFLLILNMLDWNKSHYLYVGWCVISFHVFYIMFFQINEKKNLRSVLKPQLRQCLNRKQLKTENIEMITIFHLFNQ